MIAIRHVGAAGGTGSTAPVRSAPLATLAILAGTLLAAEVAAGATAVDAPERPLCLYVSSYHEGYPWSDGVESGLRDALAGVCEIEQFDMDTKRRPQPEQIAAAAAEARRLVEVLQPDIIITSDDNAARHFVVPYLHGGSVPVVFSGINWTVEEYGLPTDNITGIVEVAPIRPMIREAMALVPGATRAAYIGAPTLAEQKNFERIAAIATEHGVIIDHVIVEDFEAWKVALEDAQNYDFVVVGSHADVNGWDTALAADHALATTRRPSLTNYEWMMPVSVVGYTKLPEEHGERAGATARAILAGTAIRDIPLVVNRKWDTWLNVALAERLDTNVPERLRQRAKHIEVRP